MNSTNFLFFQFYVTGYSMETTRPTSSQRNRRTQATPGDEKWPGEALLGTDQEKRVKWYMKEAVRLPQQRQRGKAKTKRRPLQTKRTRTTGTKDRQKSETKLTYTTRALRTKRNEHIV